MDTLGQELETALTAVEKERDCGCGGGSEQAAAGDGLAAELSAALDAVEAEDIFGAASEDDPFADLSMAGDGGASLEDILAVAERHPGLKITFSF